MPKVRNTQNTPVEQSNLGARPTIKLKRPNMRNIGLTISTRPEETISFNGMIKKINPLSDRNGWVYSFMFESRYWNATSVIIYENNVSSLLFSQPHDFYVNNFLNT